MKSKLHAIWRIIMAKEFLVIGDNGLTASYGEKDYGGVIRKICESLTPSPPHGEN